RWPIVSDENALAARQPHRSVVGIGCRARNAGRSAASGGHAVEMSVAAHEDDRAVISPCAKPDEIGRADIGYRADIAASGSAVDAGLLEIRSRGERDPSTVGRK